MNKKVVKRSLTALRKATDSVLGAVLNAVDVKTGGHYYYYEHQHQKDARDKHKGKGRKEPAPAEAHDATLVS